MTNFARYWLPPIILCLVIFIQSSFPSPIKEPDVPFFDKYLHLMAYALLGILCHRAYASRWSVGGDKIKIAVLSILSAGLYGISDEVHQLFVPGRSADTMDAVVDFLGATCGVLCYRYLAKKRTRINRRGVD